MQQRRFVELMTEGAAASRCQLLAMRNGLAAVAAPHVEGRLVWPSAGAAVTLRAGEDGPAVAANVVERRLKPFPILVLRLEGPDQLSDGAAAPAGSRLIAVASGKGGTGKTMLAVNLAVSMSRSRRVVLLDADFGTANAALAFGLGDVPHIGHLLDGSAGLDEVLVSVGPSLRLLPGGSGSAELANLNEWQFGRLVTVLEELDRRADVILIDVGAGVGRSVTNLLAVADDALLVTNPEPAALLDAYALIKVLARQERRPVLHVLVNRARRPADAHQAYERVRLAAAEFLGLEPSFAGVVSEDDAVLNAARARRPLVEFAPASRAAREINAAASRLLAGVAAPPAAEPAGWLSRLRALFAN